MTSFQVPVIVCTNQILSEEEAAGLWEYYDDHGRVQGPFRASKLLSWLRAVRRSAGSSDF